MELLNSNKIDFVSIDSLRTIDLLKLMDTVVIKLEGGGEEDIEAMEQEYSGIPFVYCKQLCLISLK